MTMNESDRRKAGQRLRAEAARHRAEARPLTAARLAEIACEVESGVDDGGKSSTPVCKECGAHMYLLRSQVWHKWVWWCYECQDYYQDIDGKIDWRNPVYHYAEEPSWLALEWSSHGRTGNPAGRGSVWYWTAPGGCDHPLDAVVEIQQRVTRKGYSEAPYRLYHRQGKALLPDIYRTLREAQAAANLLALVVKAVGWAAYVRDGQELPEIPEVDPGFLEGAEK